MFSIRAPGGLGTEGKIGITNRQSHRNPPFLKSTRDSSRYQICQRSDRSESNARLSNFGLALRCVNDYKLRPTLPAGTMGYLDLCYVTPENLSTKTDVFRIGILLLEILSGRKAIEMGNSPPSIVDWAIPLIRKWKLLSVYDPIVLPPKDPMVRKTLAVLATKCMRSCRERRLSMDVVAGCLRKCYQILLVMSLTCFLY
ncbi:serine/threonine-protein kinase-like protein at3g51990 [Phtheirospermum japonicum]|uniref:Serine/threonine-protein kinase-like protein at3g51990 n=1 Tax=Phtheirospermum japonicum TaxID=374723 RepID=A0A830C1S9_9LAMI|nr:serine/threonine-protein kinase-like protein at3g51990 [Phtheirospermum japonicum]